MYHRWVKKMLAGVLAAMCVCSAVPAQAAEEDAVIAEDTAVEETAAEETAPEETAPEETAPEETAAGETTAPELIVQEQPYCTVMLLKTEGGSLVWAEGMQLPEALETDRTDVADLRIFPAGTQVVLTAVPDAGYETEAVCVLTENGEPRMLELTEEGYPFTLPEGNVQVYALFRAAAAEPEAAPAEAKDVPVEKAAEAAGEAEDVPAAAAAETRDAVPAADTAETQDAAPAAAAAEEVNAKPAVKEKEKIPKQEETAEAEETVAEEELVQEEEKTPSVSYRTHVQYDGWQDYVSDGAIAGTTGRSLRLEGINIKLSGAENSGIEYMTHVQNIGWQDWVKDGALAGTTGMSLRLEAIQIRLTGDAASKYDVYYCTHVQDFGWLNWAKNGQMSGSAAYSRRLEGIRVQIVKKGDPAPEPMSEYVGCFYDKNGGSAVGPNNMQVIYNTHVQDIGWQDWVGDGALGGTSGMSKRLEAVHIRLQNQTEEGSIQYCTHVEDIGWMDWVQDSVMSGTAGKSLRLEAIQIRLTGKMAEKYDVWYRTHVQNFGWLDWAKNGDPSGSEGYSYRMEAIEVKLLPKGSEAPGSTETPYKKTSIREQYPLASSRLDQIGWGLDKAFVWSASMPYVRLTEDASYGARYFATYGFEHGAGDCYVMAACFYEMAKALGYNAHWMTGYTPLRAGGLGIHSWVEIDYNGTTVICDPDCAHEGYTYGNYWVPYSQAVWQYYYGTRQN